MALTPNTRLGPYEIVAPIGAGGMGEVYRARDARLGRDVAVKILPSRLAEDRVALARFEREARAVAALSHPNIMAIFDIGHEGAVTYTVAELLEGGTLRESLKAGALPVRKAVEYGCQVAQGLAAAHEKGIVHRDLKPENIFVAPDGRVKILDFGLARQVAGAGSGDPYERTVVAATDPGMIAGTPAYMAPEQVRGEELTPQADIFAFGAVLFEMLAGRRAFQGETPAETMTAVLREDPPELTALDARIPVQLVHLVRHCMEKQPGERFRSARDLAFQLQVIAGTPTPSGAQQAMASSEVEPAGAAGGEADRKRPRAVRWRWAAASLCLAAIAFAGGWYLRQREAPAGPRFQRLSHTQKPIFRAAFAPEAGTEVYSAAIGGNQPELFLRRAEYPTAKPMELPGTHLLAISKTGELALLTRARVVGSEVLEGTLARMSFGAAVPRELLEHVRDADWSPDGGELVVVRAVDGQDRLEWPEGRVLHRTGGYLTDVHVSPAGDQVALFEHPRRWDGRGSLILVDRAGKRTPLTSEYRFAHGLAWRPDGKEVVFSANQGGEEATAIYGVDLSGRTRLLLETVSSLTIQDIEPGGRWLVTRDDRRVGLRALAPGTTAERELSWLDRSSLAALADDGRKVLFSELAPPAGNSGTVCLRDTDGSPVIPLGAGQAQGLSPDGRYALAIADGPPRLVLYPTGAGEARTLPRGSIDEYRWAGWFPDGSRILVCGAEKGKSPRCFVQGAQGGEPRGVTADGEWGVVSPDGSRIAVWRTDRAPVIYPVDGQAPLSVPSATDGDVPIRWTPDGRGLLVYRPQQIPGQIDLIELASGRRESVRQLSPIERTGMLSIGPVFVSPDHASYAYGYARLLSTLFAVDGMR